MKKKLLTLLFVLCATIQGFAFDNYLKGTWGVGADWTANDGVKFVDGKLTLHLAANKTYQFKVFDTNGDQHYTDMNASNENTPTMTRSNCTRWAINKPYNDAGANTGIRTDVEGDYVFSLVWDDGGPHLSVTYPDYYLCGDWGIAGYTNWQHTDPVKFVDGKLKLNLAADRTYNFKLWYTGKNPNNNENNWLVDEGEGTMQSDNCKRWAITTDHQGDFKDTHIRTTVAGEYVFDLVLDNGGPHLSVTYPDSYLDLDFVEYIGGNNRGNSNIHTGYIPNENTNVEIKFRPYVCDYGWRAIYCSRNGSDSGTGVSLYVNGGDANKLGYFIGELRGGGDNLGDISSEPYGDHVVKANLRTLNVDGIETATGQDRFNASTRDIALFANPEWDNSFKGRIYYFVIKEGETLKHNFVPKMRLSDGAVGFYDTVTKVFVIPTNASGFRGIRPNETAFTAIDGTKRDENFDSYTTLFDGDLNTKWEDYPQYDYGDYYGFNNDHGNVVFEASSAVYVNGITLYTGADTQSYPARNPREWTLYGSNDKEAWTVINHVNACQMPAENSVGKYFKFNPGQTAYKYFKFHVNNLVGKDELQLAELVLDYSKTPLAPTTVVADAGAYGGEGSANLFDGSGDTKWCRSNDGNKWVVFKTAKPMYATNYTFQTGGDAANRDPKKYTLYAALDSAPTTDGSTTGWTEIDHEDDASGAIPTDRTARATFSIDNPGLYQYYMLKVDETRGADGSFQISELLLDGDVEVISTDEDMAEYANKVNLGKTNLSAILLADVNSVVSVGTPAHKFNGTFDGQGHTVNLNIASDLEFQGLIGCATGGAVIKNVVTTGSVKGLARSAGILGGSRDGGEILIDRCGNEASVTVTGANAGGIHGCNNGSAAHYTITNSYNTGDVKGANESAALSGWLGDNAVVTNCYNAGNVLAGQDGDRSFARWNSGTYTNCYNTLAANEFAGRTDSYPAEKVASGELCIALGAAFTQDLANENHPTFGSKTVYSSKWDGTNDVYYNDDNHVITASNVVINDMCDNFTFPAEATSVTAKSVTYIRSGVAGYNTVCMPFEFKASDLGLLAESYVLTFEGTNDGVVTFRHAEEDAVIAAGTPCMIYTPSANTWDFNASDVALAVEPNNGGAFKGSFTTHSLSDGVYKYSNAENAFCVTNNNAGMTYPFRAYLDLGTNGAAKMSLFINDDANGINAIEMGDMNSAEIYSVNGMRQPTLQNGMNIVKMSNGKTVKIMVK